MNKFSILIITVVLIGGGFYVVKNIISLKGQTGVCATDTQTCPGGGYVNRITPSCNFAKCPEVISENAIGYTVTQSGISITPLEVISDSRCPQDVHCIQPGTVVVRTQIAHNGNTQEVAMSLGGAAFIANKRIELSSVTPNLTSGTKINDTDYRFSFTVTEAAKSDTGILQGTVKIDLPEDGYADYKIVVYSEDKTVRIAVVNPNEDGKFSLAIAPGTYYLSMATSTPNIGKTTELPKTVTIKPGETTTLSVVFEARIR